MKSLFVFCVVAMASLTSWTLASPVVPGDAQNQPIAIVNATVHPISRPTLNDATILFDQGKVVAVGETVAIPDGTKVIDGSGKHVYPALFCAGGHTGLREINAIRSTRDSAEISSLNPNVKTHVAVNPDSELIPVTRANGVLLVLSEPSGGLISGVSAVMQLDGWTWEDMTLEAAAGLHISWPRMNLKSDEENARLRQLNDFFDQATHYHQAAEANHTTAVDLRLAAMAPVLRKELPIIVAADSMAEIQAAVTFAMRRNLKLIIRGGYDAPHCAELLKAHDVPVIVPSVYRLPQRRHNDYDEAYTLPARLSKAGVSFCIAGVDRFGAPNLRNLPYHAATSAAYGLSPAEALKAITLYPAQILGVADRVGSLEPSRDATIIVTDGNPLETQTHVLQAFVQGRAVDLSNRHETLWKKYLEKYRRQESRSDQSSPDVKSGNQDRTGARPRAWR